VKYVDEFRAPHKARARPGGIERLSASIETCRTWPLQIMEACGGHTHTMFRYGLEQMLPERIELVHGPVCTVCVLPMGRDGRPGVLMRTTFGSSAWSTC
jgi:hydrogenase expression/formation protein HypD